MAEERTGFIERTWKASDGKEWKYTIFVPHNYSPDKRVPAILFLHGAGESGTDGKRPTHVGLGPAIRKREKTFPFLVVFPQAEKTAHFPLYTWYPGKPDGDRAIAILDSVTKEFKVDPAQQYLTGNSMGGYGVWAWAEKDPKRWAAIVPVCGGGDSGWATTLKDLPIWCFHGAKDRAVPARASRAMIDAIRVVGGTPKYTEYPDVGHDSWDKAYGNDELYEWMLEHKSK
jgi:predicted peptidase